MKPITEHSPEDLTIDEVWQRFSTDDAAREYLEGIRWPDGPVCPHCGNAADKAKIWKVEADPEKEIRPGLYECGNCDKQFTVTVGTIFEDSHVPLRKWMVAWWLINTSKKGISALQIQRMLGLGSYRTALFMMHRIRHALQDPAFTGKLSGTVEIDETYVGGKQRGVGSGSKEGKTPVVSLVERGGDKRSQIMERVTGKNLRQAIKDNVEICSRVMTDDSFAYRGLVPKYDHAAVKHSRGEYVRGDVHTNTVEGSFSLLKRGIVGTFHSVSRKHLPLYLAEFDHRWNHRKVSDGQRTVAGLRKVSGRRLTYKKLVGRGRRF
jgi:transposase-like protein